MIKTIATALTLGVAAAPTALAQDDCSTAISLQGTGTWQWYATGSSSSTFGNGTDCEISAGYQERFFQWSAPTSGTYQFDTIASTFDTEIAVHQGVGCAATCLAFDDLHGSPLPYNAFFGSGIVIIPNITQGDDFLIHVGNLPDSHTPWLGMTIREVTDDCANMADDFFEDNDTIDTRYPLSDGFYGGLHANLVDYDYYGLTVEHGETISVDTILAPNQDPVASYLLEIVPNGNQFNFVGSGTSMSWTNGSGAPSQTVLIVAMASTSVGDTCSEYSLLVSGSSGGPFETNPFCSPMDANSSGLATTLLPSTQNVTTTGLNMGARNGPVGHFAYLVVGNASSEPGLVVGDGRFCLGFGPGDFFGRYNQNGTELNSIGRFSPDGVLVNVVGTSASGLGFDVPALLPMSIPGMGQGTIAPGQTWHFQLWHRDTAGTTNYSNGLSVSF